MVRKVDGQTGLISTLAGTNVAGFSGDGGPAERAQLRQPHSIAIDRQQRLLICDIGNQRIRRVDLATGIIETYAGTGVAAPTPTARPCGTPLNGPRTMVFDERGTSTLRCGRATRSIALRRRRQTLHHVAGTGKQGYSGDGGPARAAELARPEGAGLRSGGILYVADTENHVIRKIDLAIGIIATVIGTGQRETVRRRSAAVQDVASAWPHRRRQAGAFYVPTAKRTASVGV